MANRHLSRSIVLQTLFEWDFVRKSDDASLDILARNAEEFAPGMGDVGFAVELIRGILTKRPSLDAIIEKAAPDWPIDKISPIDRNVLRIGLFELVYGDSSEVPAKVAINEAIELAKTFGGENSGKFVNGVLGAVYKEMGEPGKDDTGRKKTMTPEDISKLPVDKLVGSIVYAREGADVHLALVHDVFGRWTLSKGHVDEGESDEQAVVRVSKRELGIDVVPTEPLGVNEYVASHPEKGKMRKRVSYFISEAKMDTLIPEKTGGLDDARWFKLSEIEDLNMYDDILPIVARAITILLKKEQVAH